MQNYSLEWSETTKRHQEEWGKPSKTHHKYQLASPTDKYANNFHPAMWKSSWNEMLCSPCGHALTHASEPEHCKLPTTICKHCRPHFFLIAHSILDIGYYQMAIVTSGNMIPYLISEFTYTIMHTWPIIEWNLAVYTESPTLPEVPTFGNRKEGSMVEWWLGSGAEPRLLSRGWGGTIPRKLKDFLKVTMLLQTVNVTWNNRNQDKQNWMKCYLFIKTIIIKSLQSSHKRLPSKLSMSGNS